MSGHQVHKFVHDGRHLLGFPCHQPGRDIAMARTLLLRGMLIGLAAGLVALAFTLVFAEPQVARDCVRGPAGPRRRRGGHARPVDPVGGVQLSQ